MGRNGHKFSDKRKTERKIKRVLSFKTNELLIDELLAYLGFRQDFHQNKHYKFKPEAVVEMVQNKETNIYGISISYNKRGGRITADEKDRRLFKKWKNRKIEYTPNVDYSGMAVLQELNKW